MHASGLDPEDSYTFEFKSGRGKPGEHKLQHQFSPIRYVRSGSMRTTEVENDMTIYDTSDQAAPAAHTRANPLVISLSTHQPIPMQAIELYSGEDEPVIREVTMADQQDCDYSTILAQTSQLSLEHNYNTPK